MKSEQASDYSEITSNTKPDFFSNFFFRKTLNTMQSQKTGTTMKLYCTSCNYQFAPKTDKLPKRCPYCDKIGTIEKVAQMQDLIDDVGRQEAEKEGRAR